jgi:hypothetical protein
MDRQDLQRLSQQRRRDAKVLFDNGHYAGSYYVLGYAVECGIKSAIAKNVQRHDFPELTVVKASYSHRFDDLLKTAGLWNVFSAAMNGSPALQANWAVVKDWDVTSRYTLSTSRLQARDFYSACTAQRSGFLSWLRTVW